MTTDENRDLLLALDKERWRGENTKKWGAAPWLVSANHAEWAVATEGHVMLLIPRELVAGECFPVPESVGTLAVASAAVSETDVLINTAELAEFVSSGFVSCDECKNTRLVRCEECNGTGWLERECEHCPESHKCVCDECEDGMATCEACAEGNARNAGYASLLGGPINRDLIRRILPAADLRAPIRIGLRAISPKSSQTVFIFQQDRHLVAAISSLHPSQKPPVTFENRATWETNRQWTAV